MSDYEDADGPYEGVFLRQQVAGVGVAPGFLRTAHVRALNGAARSWRVTCTPYRATSTGGQIWNPRFAPVWGAEVLNDQPGGQGRVAWGDGQVEHQTTFDWRRGGSFVVHGTYVDVDVTARLQAFGVGPQDPQLFAGATIAPARDDGGGELTTSRHTGVVIPGAANAVLVDIPDYAKAFRFYQTANADPANVPASMQFAAAEDPGFVAALRQGSNVGVFSTGGVRPAAAAFADPRGWWWTLEAAVRFLAVTNLSAFNVGGWVEFLLDVG